MKTCLRWLPSVAPILFVFLLASCQNKASAPADPTVPVVPSSATPTTSSTPFPTMTPLPTVTGEPSVPARRAMPLVLPAGLAVEEYSLKKPPEAEASLYFTHGDPHLLHSNERAQTLPNPHCTEASLTMCASLGMHQLVAEEVYPNDGGSGNVILKQDGVEIYRIAIGPGSPVNALQGLWVYDSHWVLEAAKITETLQGNMTMVNAVGRIIVDGQILNDSRGYEEAFSFQTLHGRPFYFFKRHGKIEASYDGVEIPLDYNQIPHYGCCSAAELNPRGFQNMLDFFATRDGIWYFVEIGVFNQP